jgi:hypothetical protein
MDYKVTVEGSAPIPVRASNSASARNHAVKQKVKVEKLSTEDAIQFGRDGIELQIAGEDVPEAEPVAEQQGAGEDSETNAEGTKAK